MGPSMINGNNIAPGLVRTRLMCSISSLNLVNVNQISRNVIIELEVHDSVLINIL